MSSIVTTIAVSIATTLGALRGVEPPHDLPNPTDTPPAARLLLASAKTGLRDLATALLRAQPEQTAAELQQAMTDALRGAGALAQCESLYGNLEPPKVASHGDDLLAVVATLDIACGDDTAFFLFRRERGLWTLVLDRENNDYETVSGAAGAFQYRISEPDAHGSRLVLTADINPWCSSNWQSLRWELRRLHPGWRMPEEIDAGETGINIEGEVKLVATPDTFGLEYVGSSICPAHVAREYHRYYRILPGNQFERIEPIATYPLEYLEEWLIDNRNDSLNLDGEFEDVAKCRNGVWQIKHVPYDEENGKDIYFIVTEENGKYDMTAITYEPRTGCKSEYDHSADEEKELHEKPPTLTRSLLPPPRHDGGRLAERDDPRGDAGAFQAPQDDQHE